jgi:hypothetical protein
VTEKSAHEPCRGWLATSTADLIEPISERFVADVFVRTNAGTGGRTSALAVCR